MEGAMMKSRFFPRKDEFVLSTVTALIVSGLLYQGFSALLSGKSEHVMFQSKHTVSPKK